MPAAEVPQQGKNGCLQLLPVMSQPFEWVGLDLMGSFLELDTSNKWILVMINYLTKWPIAVALPDKKVETVAWVFVEELICVHDQGCELFLFICCTTSQPPTTWNLCISCP
jgi:hypothetical protein